VVLLSSRLGLVCAAPDRSRREGGHRQEPPFYQRYGSKLPSSLTRDHSSTLASSASLPVSVCSTGTDRLPSRLFATAQVSRPCGACCHARSHSPLGHRQEGLPTPSSLPAWTALISPRRYPLSILHRSNGDHVVPECLPVVHRVRRVPSP